MKVSLSGKLIFENLHDRDPPIHPKPSNFAGYMSAVEDLLLEQSGFNRGNASEASLMEISEKAKGFTKRIRLVWDKFHGKPKRILENDIEAFRTIIEVVVEAYESPIKTGPTVSESSAGPRGSRSHIPFYALSTRAQELQSAKIRLEYPAGAVIKAAERTSNPPTGTK